VPARLRSRAITVLGCVAAGSVGAWLLLLRSEEDGSLVIRGPALPVDSVRVERYALRPRAGVAVSAPGRPREPEVGASEPAPTPEPIVEPPPRPRRAPAPVAPLVPLPEELPSLDELEPSSDAGTTAAAPAEATEAAFPPFPPPPPAPPPHAPRGTNNAPIFD